MKKLLYSIALLSLLIACSKEDDPKPVVANDDYFPNTTGSSWVFTGAVEGTMIVTGEKKVFDGKEYTEIESENSFGTNSSYLYKSKGEYHNRGLILQGEESIDLILLKDNVAEGNTWEQTISYGGYESLFKFTLEEKDISMEVNGENFNNVIHVSMVQTFELLGSEFQLSTISMYFAKGVGMIKTSTEYDPLSGLEEFNGFTEIESYDIK